VFGRRWGKAESLREEVRARLAASTHERVMLADAISKLESTLAADIDQRANLQAATEKSLGSLRESVSGNVTDLSKGVEEIARMCALLAEHIDSERTERRALIEAVGMLARQSIEPDPSKPRLVGGNVYAAPDAGNEAEIVLIDDGHDERERAPRFAIGDAVRCRFGDGWIDGLEVCELVADGDRVRYRLRRAADQYVLPARFEGRDLALGDDTSTPPDAPGRWSRS